MTRRVILLAGAAVAYATAPLPAQPQLLDDAIVRVSAMRGPNVGQGTGFFISADGLIATAYHVIHGASRIDVTVRGETLVPDVTVVAMRPDADIALLRIPAERSARFYQVPATPPGGVPGEKLYVHGHPLGFPKQVLTGARTQKGYLPSQQWLDDASTRIFVVPNLNLLPLDITAEPGLSGSPVLDGAGQVLGVFSGSLQRGRGYAWAVPVENLRLATMQQVGQRAAAVPWPTSVGYLRAGLRLERSRTGAGDELWQQCRRRVDTFSEASNRYYSRQFKLGRALSVAEPAAASTRKQLTRSNATQMKGRVLEMWESLLPDLTWFRTEGQTFQSSQGDMVATCTGEAVLRTLPTPRPPATYENVLANTRFGRRMNEIAERWKRIVADDRVRLEALANQVGRLFDANVQIKRLDVDDYQLTVAVLDLIEGWAKIVAGADNATVGANLVGAGLSMSELLQHLSLHEWETVHTTHAYATAGVKVALTEGWLPYDARLRAATIAPGRSVAESVQIIAYRLIDENVRPQAFAQRRGWGCGVFSDDCHQCSVSDGSCSRVPSPTRCALWV